MKNGCLIMLIMLLSSMSIFPQERMVLKELEALNITDLMEDSQIYITSIYDLDFDDEGNVYILDGRSGNVVGFNLKTHSLINRISSMGQGPAELMWPTDIRIRNKKVFILSSGFIKIFSIRGEFQRGFRPESYPTGLAVDEDEKIYVSGTDRKGNPTISVYDVLGNFIKTAWTLQLKKETLENKGELFKNQIFFFRIDREGNIIILHHLLRNLTKVSPNGTLLWKRKIENSLLEPFYKEEGTVYDNQGRPTVSGIIAKFDTDQDNNIVIAHWGGGCIYSPKGELIYLIEVHLEDSNDGPRVIRLPRITKDRLLAVFINSNALLFPYRLKKLN